MKCRKTQPLIIMCLCISNFYATFGKYGDGRSVQRKINTYFGCENKVKEW